MTRWPISAISWNGYPPSPITGFMNCCRTTGNPHNNRRLTLKRHKPKPEISAMILYMEEIMKRSKFIEAQMVSILKLVEQGANVTDICREHGISSATYYQWKSKYGGLEASDPKRLRDIDAENAKLKRMYAELALENAAIKDLLGKL